MKKLKLDLDRIRVESFRVEGEEGRAGTVNAFGALPRFAYGANTGASCTWCLPDTISENPANC